MTDSVEQAVGVAMQNSAIDMSPLVDGIGSVLAANWLYLLAFLAMYILPDIIMFIIHSFTDGDTAPDDEIGGGDPDSLVIDSYYNADHSLKSYHTRETYH